MSKPKTNFDGWNCRILMRRDEHGEPNFSVNEVFYDKDGKPVGWACSPCSLSWETEEDLRGYAKMIMLAFDKPVLNVDDTFGRLQDAEAEPGEEAQP